jgi:hypothetical protein
MNGRSFSLIDCLVMNAHVKLSAMFGSICFKNLSCVIRGAIVHYNHLFLNVIDEFHLFHLIKNEMNGWAFVVGWNDDGEFFEFHVSQRKEIIFLNVEVCPALVFESQISST